MKNNLILGKILAKIDYKWGIMSYIALSSSANTIQNVQKTEGWHEQLSAQEVQEVQEMAELWFSFMRGQHPPGQRQGAGRVCLKSRPTGTSPNHLNIKLYKLLDRLYRQRRLLIDHVRVLAHYGRKQHSPNPNHWREQRAALLWQEALSCLAQNLRQEG
jgi:hypothetical protein